MRNLVYACCLVCLIAVRGSAAASGTVMHLSNTTVSAVKVDTAGNTYVTGFQGTIGSRDTYDAFVAKLSADGTKVLYSTTLGGNKSDFASAMEIDASGAAYVFGQTQSPDFPATPGALQTTLQSSQGQGFVAKLDPQGRVVYATLVGGGAYVDPGSGGILVDQAGEVYVSGSTLGSGFPNSANAPFTGTDPGSQFVMKLDAGGGKLLAAIRGLGGRLAFDGAGNVYLAGATSNYASSLPITPGAFQTTFTVTACSGTGQLASGCAYQYVAKLDAALTQIVYCTVLTGSYGASPAAIFADAQGDALVAGTTNSPDYPTSSNAFQPLYVANAPPGPQVNLFGTVYPPPASGYVTRLNATGTGLLYSTFFSGTQADTITFAAMTAGGIVLSGIAGSPDLLGLEGVPFQCLPENFETRLSLDGTTITATRIVPGNVLAYDAATHTFLAWNGADLVRFDPASPPGGIACVLDAADLKPVTSIAPGQLLTIFGPHFTGGIWSQAPGSFARSLGGVSLTFNGTAAPLLYLSPQQMNVQAPFEISGSALVTVALALPRVTGMADSRTLPVVAASPAAFLDTVTPLSAVDFHHCQINGTVYAGGPLPLAFNTDGSRNTCSNPAPTGSTVTVFLQGLGVTGQAITGGINPSPGEPLDLPVTAGIFAPDRPGVTVASASALAGSISGVWQVGLQLAPNNTGAMPVSLNVGTAGGTVPVRDANLTIWSK